MTDATSTPGWADRLVAWINDLPFPPWLFYVLVILLFSILNNAVQWYGGVVPVGQFDLQASTNGVWTAFFIGYLVMLVNRGRIAIAKYRPLIPNDDQAYARWEERFTVISRRTAWSAVLLELLVVISTYLTDYSTLMPTSFADAVLRLYDLLFWSIPTTAAFAMLLFLLRQIRIIQRLHRDAAGLDLFNLAPAHAFSELTAGTGIGLILIAAFGVLQGWVTPSPTWLAYDAILMVIGVLVFIVPLRGMRRKLHEVKTEELRKANLRLKDVYARLNAQVDDESYADVSGLNTAIGALTHERDEIARISTLPWDTSTFRGFASAFLLPITLFIVTQLLSRFF